MKKHIRLISEIYTLRTITGGEGQDTVNGGGGDDTIILGTQAEDGTDDIIGGSGVDTIQIGAGASFVFSTADSKLQGVENVQLGSGASVTLTGQTEGFNVIGGGGAETIITSTGNDTVNAGLGNDFIQAAAGADVINGGAGQDTVSYADVTGATAHNLTGITGMAVNFTGDGITDGTIGLSQAGVTVANSDPNNVLAAGTVQYLTGGAKAAGFSVDTITGIEGFVGSALNDFIALGADAVTVTAGAGNDAIISGTAADNIDAGAGADVINIGAASDHSSAETITGGDGADTIRFNSVLGETLVLSANVTGVETVAIASVNGTATGTTAENINASALTAGIALVGNDGANILTGSAFADTFDGGAGDDRLIVDDADTLVDGGAGTDTMVLGSSATFAAAELVNVENASLASGANLTVNHSDMSLIGLTGLTSISGTNDASTETVTVNGAALGEIANMDLRSFFLNLDNVALDYRGGSGVDNVVGTTGNDVISGGFGNDVINGGGGSDTLSGGDGYDQFNVGLADSASDIIVISDFEVATATGTGTAHGGDELAVAYTAGTAAVASTAARADLFDVTTLSSGETVESFQVLAEGVVTFYDENTTLAGTQTLTAQTDADVIALTEALLLNVGTSGSYMFGLDRDGNGSAESSVVVTLNTSTGLTNIVQLNDVVANGIAYQTAAAADDVVIMTPTELSGDAADTPTLTGNADVYAGLGGDDVIDGLAGDDLIAGGDGNDSLTGGIGDDIINGDAGADTIIGGEGSDTIDGGLGADVYAFSATTINDATAGDATVGLNEEGSDIITFDTASDVIQFGTAVFTAASVAAGSDAFTEITASDAATVANKAIFEISGIGEVTSGLDGTDADDVASVLANVTVASTSEIVFAVDNGTDTYLWAFNGDGGGTAAADVTVDASELDLVATLVGVTDLASDDFVIA